MIVLRIMLELAVMKTRILIFLFLCLIFCTTSCIRWLYEDSYAPYYAKFFIKNNTEENIEILCNENPECLVVAPEDSVSIGLVETKRRKGYPSFRSALHDTDVETVSVGKDGTVLKVWTEAGRNEPGRQLFDESCWRYYIREYNDEPDYFIWVFDIVPEDLPSASAD